MTTAGARLRFVVMLGLLALCAGAWPVAQVVQQPPGTVTTVGTGFISGQVVEYPSGRPIGEVSIATIGRNAAPAPPPGAPAPAGRGGAFQSPVIATDAQGRFYFPRLPAGVYSFQVLKPGYLNNSQTLLFELGDGERLTDLRIRLAPVAIISGTTRDSAGDPVVGHDVIAYRRTVVNGKAGLQAAGRGRTDDRGVYRIGGLSAGDYVICACTRDPNPFDPNLLTTIASEPLSLLSVAARALNVGADVVSLDNTLRTYPPRFHPDSPSVARATRIALAPGEDKTGADVSLELVRATRVSGQIVGAQSPLTAFELRMLPATDADAGIDVAGFTPMLMQADGRFDFANVPPGQYRLIVSHVDTDQRGGGPSGTAMGFVGARGAATPAAPTRLGGPGTPSPTLWANEPITVGESGLRGLVIALNQPLSVSGRLHYVGAAPQPPPQQLTRAGVTLAPATSLTQSFARSSTVSPDGTFVITNVTPGRYFASSTALPGYPTVKSVTLGGVDITDMPFDVTDKNLSELVITYVDTPMPSLTITTQMPPAAQMNDDLAVLVFPADRKYWPEFTSARRRFGNALMPAKGVLAASPLPAGDYFVLLVDAFDARDWQDPAKLEQFSRRAQRVTLGDGGKQTVEVRR